MYNRYIPQPDGSYRKDRIPDTAPPRPQVRHQRPQEQPPASRKETPICPPEEAVHAAPTATAPVLLQQKHSDAGDFLRKLLPKDLDTGDLLIIILLLLMAGDCKEEKNTALLTLALYFFL